MITVVIMNITNAIYHALFFLIKELCYKEQFIELFISDWPQVSCQSQ